MKQRHAVRVLVDDLYRIEPGEFHPEHIQLTFEQLGLGAFEQIFETGFALDVLEFKIVIVIGQAHPGGGDDID